MDAELEALVKALDGFLQARGAEAKELEAIYESKLDQVIERNPNVSKPSLKQAIIFEYNRWRMSQDKKFPTMPPKA